VAQFLNLICHGRFGRRPELSDFHAEEAQALSLLGCNVLFDRRFGVGCLSIGSNNADCQHAAAAILNLKFMGPLIFLSNSV
jgi:hypothetical protein